MGQIYKITCTANNKFYIGSAISAKERFRKHKSALKHKKHHSPYLQNSWDKYGPDKFEFEIIEEVKNHLLLEREQIWLDLTQSYIRHIGFNICKKAGSSIGVKHSSIAIDKMSKKYIVTSPEGEESKITNLRKFCRDNKLLVGEMCNVANGNANQHRKWHCRHEDMSISDWENIRKLKIKPNLGTLAKWYIKSPEGEEQIIVNLSNFCKQNNLCDHLMREIDKGRRKTYKGWKCKKIPITDI